MNDEHLHRACESKDASFDGWFYVGVTSTGIYCRPSCPARTPKRENRRFYGTAQEARAAGFRACRRCKPDSSAGERPKSPITVSLPYRPPIEAGELLEFFAVRAIPGVEEVADRTYRRSLRLPRGSGTVALRPADGHFDATFDLDDPRDLARAIERCRRMLDLDADPQRIVEHLGGDATIGAQVQAAPGRRVPGTADSHEQAVRAVLGQQISVSRARTLAGRLVAERGERHQRPNGAVTHLFPDPSWIATTGADRLGMPGARRRALSTLAAALATQEIDLGPITDPADAEQRLLALPGIGPWTASYIAMRALRDPDAFLPTDLGVRKALEQLGEDASAAGARRIAERWRPHRAAACHHLWATLTKPVAASVQQAA